MDKMKQETLEEAKQRAKNYMSLKGALDSQYVDFSNPNADKITSASTTTIKEKPKQGLNLSLLEQKLDEALSNETEESLNTWLKEKRDKQETTLEEAAKKFVLSHDFSKLTNPNHLANRCFQFGAKWQQERMYSEAIEFGKWLDENMQQREYYPMMTMTMEELFEQYKNK